MLRTICLGLCALSLLGCPKQIDFGPGGEVKDARELLQRIALAEQQVFHVQGEAKLKVDAPQGRGASNLFVSVTHPALIHLESLGFFGKPQAVLVSDGTVFSLYQAEEGKLYRGPATPENLSRFLPVVMPPGELAALLLGRAPRIPGEPGELSIDREVGSYRLDLVAGKVRQKLWVDTRTHRVVRSRVEGANAYELDFEALESIGGTVMPRRAILNAPHASTRMELSYRDIELNRAPDLTLYELTPPENVQLIEVDGEGRPLGPGPAGPKSPGAGGTP